MLKTQWATAGMETVTVMARGLVLESVSFADAADAAGYKRDVRRWAFEKSIVVRIWSRGYAVAGPGSASTPGMQFLAATC